MRKKKAKKLVVIKDKFEKNKNLAIFLVVVFVAAGVLYFFKGQFIVAIVNGKPISRLALIRKLEKQAGKSALDDIVTETLILQEAQKQNVVVSDEEVNQEIKQIEEDLAQQGQNLNQVLGAQGGTQSELKERIKIQKTVEKIVANDLKVTDEEVEDYLEANIDLLPEDMDREELKANVKRELGQQRLNEEIQLWVKSLRDSAEIDYFLEF